jgi:hypothetical protein
MEKTSVLQEIKDVGTSISGGVVAGAINKFIHPQSTKLEKKFGKSLRGGTYILDPGEFIGDKIVDYTKGITKQVSPKTNRQLFGTSSYTAVQTNNKKDSQVTLNPFIDIKTGKQKSKVGNFISNILKTGTKESSTETKQGVKTTSNQFVDVNTKINSLTNSFINTKTNTNVGTDTKTSSFTNTDTNINIGTNTNTDSFNNNVGTYTFTGGRLGYLPMLPGIGSLGQRGSGFGRGKGGKSWLVDNKIKDLAGQYRASLSGKFGNVKLDLTSKSKRKINKHQSLTNKVLRRMV